MRWRASFSNDQVSSTAATVSATTRPIQNPVVDIGAAGRHGNHAGASPSTQPSGSEMPQKATSWMIIGGRVTW